MLNHLGRPGMVQVLILLDDLPYQYRVSDYPQNTRQYWQGNPANLC